MRGQSRFWLVCIGTGFFSYIHEQSHSTHSLKLVQKKTFTLWWSPGLVGWSRAVVGCVGCRVSPIQGCVAGLAVARLGLAIWRGHWSVLVYIHPQFITKSGWDCETIINNYTVSWFNTTLVYPVSRLWTEISPQGCVECKSQWDRNTIGLLWQCWLLSLKGRPFSPEAAHTALLAQWGKCGQQREPQKTKTNDLRNNVYFQISLLRRRGNSLLHF